MITKLAMRNEKNKENLWVFRSISRPIISTGVSMTGVLTHQTAMPLPKSPVIKIENAAGLNICFFLIAKIYLEAMAITGMRINKGRSEKLATGVKMKNKMKAVILADSTLVWTLKSFAKIIFVTHATI